MTVQLREKAQNPNSGKLCDMLYLALLWWTEYISAPKLGRIYNINGGNYNNVKGVHFMTSSTNKP